MLQVMARNKSQVLGGEREIKALAQDDEVISLYFCFYTSFTF